MPGRGGIERDQTQGMRGGEAEPLNATSLERAIGVIYRPETERGSHYFRASLARQFDAIFHLDETTAVEPFDTGGPWRTEEVPETYPSGL
ncbi:MULTISPECIES: erythromycin esterase family protein [Halomonadaceae]|uniref:erythromycin esterase family protein n=1 Tax=Halomonadaceae TaxID=28256 RepID=UPI0020C61E38|nr:MULTISPECIES: erythromycin esterase family protein [Halomonas]MDI4636767.1 erythromycin esterase family protein [Halomonas sp. BMC7]